MLSHYLLQFGYWRTKTKLIIGPAMSHHDGEVLCKMVQDWTNDTINKIHSDWDSYFSNHQTIQE